tara:strand:+ start:2424 stop:2762 length:339 start_codon:yes stop_codon:yes gene_type:complete
MNIFKSLIVLFFTMLSSSAFSGEWSIASKVLVTYAHSSSGGYGVFQLENMTINPNTCTSPMYYVVSKVNNSVFDEVYSMLLAAHLSEKKVQVWIAGCSPHNHPEIQHARLVE